MCNLIRLRFFSFNIKENLNVKIVYEWRTKFFLIKILNYSVLSMLLISMYLNFNIYLLCIS